MKSRLLGLNRLRRTKQPERIVTNLAEIITLVQDQVSTQDDDLVIAVVSNLSETGRLKAA